MSSDRYRVALFIGATFGSCAVAALAAPLPMTGVNLAGAEFGSTTFPGTPGTNYFYPTSGEVDYFTARGMNTFRLPFRWERLQAAQNAALNSAELGRMNAFVNYATAKGASVILDPHNFARYYPGSNIQGSTTGVVGGDVPNASFADFWSRVATQYKNNPKVVFNLMNEPSNINADQWAGSANAAIAAIRATGATNLILVPGVRYTGAFTWFNTNDGQGRSNAAAMLDIVDSGKNFAFDVHQYLDNDGSGTSAQIGVNGATNNAAIGQQRLVAFTNWLHANNRRGFLGEFAVANSTVGTAAAQVGDEAIDQMLNYIESPANRDVWMGWNWWAAGPAWGEYMFTLEPTSNGTARAALAPLVAHVPEPTLLAALGGVATIAVARRPRRPRRPS